MYCNVNCKKNIYFILKMLRIGLKIWMCKVSKHLKISPTICT